MMSKVENSAEEKIYPFDEVEEFLRQPDYSPWRSTVEEVAEGATRVRQKPKPRPARDAGIAAREGILVVPGAKITPMNLVWVLTRAPRMLTEDEVSLLLVLIGYVDVKKHEWTVFPSAATLAENRQRKSAAAIRRQLKALQAKGLLALKRGRSSSLTTLHPGEILRCVGDRKTFEFFKRKHMLSVWASWRSDLPEDHSSTPDDESGVIS